MNFKMIENELSRLLGDDALEIKTINKKLKKALHDPSLVTDALYLEGETVVEKTVDAGSTISQVLNYFKLRKIMNRIEEEFIKIDKDIIFDSVMLSFDGKLKLTIVLVSDVFKDKDQWQRGQWLTKILNQIGLTPEEISLVCIHGMTREEEETERGGLS